MIDCHCHLVDEQFTKDVGEVIERAQNNGVKAAIVCAEFRDQFEPIIELAERFPSFSFPAIGIHPVQRGGRSARSEDVASISNFFEEHKDRIVAVGEVGLDYTPRYMNTSNAKEEQLAVLRHQIDLSHKYNLPLNVHSRSAGRPAIEVLRRSGAKNVLLHAFSGNVKSAQPAIQEGYFFSIPPSFAQSDAKIELVKRIPIEQLCLETDSPVLGPVRGQRNEPMNIIVSAKFIASVKNVCVEDVIRITTENALRLFPLLKNYICDVSH